MPWRFTGRDIAKTNPYHIFFVEVMLQQTQIKTVIPYYHRWVKAFPTVDRLAKAPLDRVLKLWQGLGYYSRARNLHKAAQIIVAQYGGKIPSDPAALQKLPGIGRYTAGAIASIAFQRRVPLVDGNVSRVFSRLFLIRKDIGKPETQKMMYDIAGILIGANPFAQDSVHADTIRRRDSSSHHKRPRTLTKEPALKPGIFNQALMELGSLVCTPDAPKCAACPLNKICKGRKQGHPESLPVRTKLKVKKLTMAAAIIRRKNRIFVRRRPDHGIWGGLWEFPTVIVKKGETPRQAIQRQLAIKINPKPLDVVQHQLTHRHLTIYFYRICDSRAISQPRPMPGSGCWATPKQLGRLSFPVPYLRLIAQHRDPASNILVDDANKKTV